MKQRIPTANSFNVWSQLAAELINNNIQFLGFVSNFEMERVSVSLHTFQPKLVSVTWVCLFGFLEVVLHELSCGP